MTEVQVVFPSIGAALGCLNRVLPASATASWDLLQSMRLATSKAGPAAALTLPEHLKHPEDLENLAAIYGGTVTGAPGDGPWDEIVPLPGLFRRISLKATSRTERASKFLVVPRPVDGRTHADLIAAMAGLEDWSVWVRTFFQIENEETLIGYELRAIDGLSHPSPARLPGAPHVLAAVAQDVFVPAGRDLPLLPWHRRLLPPPMHDFLHVWLQQPDGRHRYCHFREPEEAEALIDVVLLERIEARQQTLRGIPARLEVPLELRRTRSRRPVERADEVVYNVESRAGEFGATLLRLLDHSEAGIERLTYFARPLGEGPNAVIEHYLLAEARIVDEDLWPGLRRYDLPRALAECGIPLFVPDDSEFVPDLEGLLAGAPTDAPFAERLRSLVGLSPGVEGRIALAEPRAADGRWEVLLLEGGKPLHEVITATLEDHHREPFLRPIDVSRADLEADRRWYESQWNAAARAEAESIVQATNRLVTEFLRGTEGVDEEMQRLADRLDSAREVTESVGDLVTSLPGTLQGFVREAAGRLAQVVGPRQEWLLGVDQTRREVAEMTDGANVLLRDARGEVERVLAAAETSGRQLAEAQENLRATLASLESRANSLLEAIRATEEASNQALVAIGARERRLQVVLADVGRSEAEVRGREAEVDALQRDVEARERELAERQRELVERDGSVRSRLLAVGRAEDEAAREEQRLLRLESHDLPAAEGRTERARRALSEIRGRRVEERLREVLGELDRQEAALEAAREREGSLQVKAAQLEAVRRELATYRAVISELEARSLDDLLAEASVARDETRHAAAASRTAVAAAASVRHALDRARDAAAKARNLSAVSRVESRLDDMEREFSVVEEAARSADPVTRRERVRHRLEDLARRIVSLRSDLGIGPKPRWWYPFRGGR